MLTEGGRRCQFATSSCSASSEWQDDGHAHLTGKDRKFGLRSCITSAMAEAAQTPHVAQSAQSQLHGLLLCILSRIEARWVHVSYKQVLPV